MRRCCSTVVSGWRKGYSCVDDVRGCSRADRGDRADTSGGLRPHDACRDGVSRRSGAARNGPRVATISPISLLLQFLSLGACAQLGQFVGQVRTAAPRTGERLMGGIGERLGTARPGCGPVVPGAAVEEKCRRHSPDRVTGCLTAGRRPGGVRLLGAGHRVVHGGEQFTSRTVDDSVMPRCGPPVTWRAS